MVVSRTIFTRLKFILPEQKKGYQLKVTLIGIHSFPLPLCFPACTVFRETRPGKLAGKGLQCWELPRTISPPAQGTRDLCRLDVRGRVSCGVSPRRQPDVRCEKTAAGDVFFQS